MIASEPFNTDLSPRLVAALEVVRRLSAVGLAVTFDSVAAQLPKCSTATARNYLEELAEAGYLQRGGRTKRSYTLAQSSPAPSETDEAHPPSDPSAPNNTPHGRERAA